MARAGQGLSRPGNPLDLQKLHFLHFGHRQRGSVTDVQESGPSWHRPKFMNSTIEILPRVRNLKTASFGNRFGPKFLTRPNKATRQPNDTVELQVRFAQSSKRVRKRFATVSLCGPRK